eukprot:9383535-Alexandrium_andersonii.AAC.1
MARAPPRAPNVIARISKLRRGRDCNAQAIRVGHDEKAGAVHAWGCHAMMSASRAQRNEPVWGA